MVHFCWIRLDANKGLENFRPDFLEKRKTGLAYFMKYAASAKKSLSMQLTDFTSCILLNPEFSGSPAVLNEFIFN